MTNIYDTIFNLNKPIWTTNHTIINSNKISDLLYFDDIKRNHNKLPILIVPPQAGHSSHIADYDINQSLVQTALNNCDNPIYCIDWKDGTPNVSIDDLLNQIYLKNIHLVGLCQGGWLSTIYASLNDDVESLTIAGSPIDFHVGDSYLTNLVKNTPYEIYEYIVNMNLGIMPGIYMLYGWKSMHFTDRYFWDYINILKSYDNENKLKKIKKFKEWYEYTQDISGKWYLWCIKKLFKENRLHELYNLNNIKCDVNIIVGGKDDITLPEQSFALKKYIKNTSDYVIDDVGHIGVFMSSKSQKIWVEVFKNIKN
jgi:poly(3-hydroxybutyrate) depolymerase